jgi:hypothetical protein
MMGHGLPQTSAEEFKELRMVVRKMVVIVLGVASLLVAVAPAVGGTTDSAGVYQLAIVPEEGAAHRVSLYCDPDGGDHVNASDACDQMRSVNGDVARLRAQQGACTLQYAPVRVSAEGTWHGEPRHYTKTYSNRCKAIRGTGGVLFEF